MKRRTLLVLTVVLTMIPVGYRSFGNSGTGVPWQIEPISERQIEPVPIPDPGEAVPLDGVAAYASAGEPGTPRTIDPEALAAAKVNASWSPQVATAQTLRVADGPRARAAKLSVNSNFAGVDATTFTTLAASGTRWSVNWPAPQVAASASRILHSTLYGLLLVDRPGNGNRRTGNLWEMTGLTKDADDEPSLGFPRLIYDPWSGRFLWLVPFFDRTRRESYYYLFVSRSGSPTGFGGGDWCSYRIDNEVQHSYASGSGIGLDESLLVFSSNTWKFAGGFNNVYFHVVDRAMLTDNANSCPAFKSSTYRAKDDDQGYVAYSVQPAVHVDDSGPGGVYMLATQWRSTGMSEYVVYRVVDNAIGRDRAATITAVRVSGDSFEHPPDIAHKGGGSLYTGEATITQAAFRDGRLVGVHAVACAQGSAPNEACLRIVEVTVDDDARATSLARLTTFGVGKNKSVFAGGVAINGSGRLVVPLHYAGSKRYLTAGFTDLEAGANKPSKVAFLKKGNYGAQCGANLDQAGPFAGAALDPNDDDAFVIAAEHADRNKPQDANNLCRWATRIGEVR